MLVLIPKGNVYTRGIGLLEVVMNVVEVLIDTRIRLVPAQDGPFFYTRSLLSALQNFA